MSEASVDVVRRLYGAMQDRDVAAVVALVHPDAVWIADTRVGEQPVQGREEIVRFFTERDAMFDALRAEPERFFDAADRVLVYLRVTGRGRASGAVFEIHIAHIWTIADGLVVRGEGYGDRNEALATIGLTE